MTQGRRLSEDLRLACSGDNEAAARVYDETCADAWLLACCVTRKPETAQQVLIDAYHAALHGADRSAPVLSPRARVLSLVHARARAAL